MLLVFKIVLVPLVVAIVSLIGRKYGQQFGGIIAGLPVILGPILIFLAIEKGESFAKASAHFSLLGVIATGTFCVTYAAISERAGVIGASMLSALSFGISAFLISLISDLSDTTSLIVVLAILALFTQIFPAYERTIAKTESGNTEIFLRMLAAGCLVLFVTEAATYLGARGSGIASVFPIAGSVLAGFTHHYYGFRSVRRLLQGYLCGLFGLALFSFMFSLMVIRASLSVTVMLAVIIAILGSLTAIKFSPIDKADESQSLS